MGEEGRVVDSRDSKELDLRDAPDRSVRDDMLLVFESDSSSMGFLTGG